MDRVKLWARGTFRPGEPAAYQSIPASDEEGEHEEDVERSGNVSPEPPLGKPDERVSPFEYAIFLLLGVAMLWSWNMFMACATYFQRRFAEDDFLLHNFQSLILAVSTVTNLSAIGFLSNKQANANYPFRVSTALVLNTVVFTLLALSTLFETPPAPYMVFTLLCVLVSSLSTGFSQNGVFAFVSRFGGAYTQAIMTGQGVAGVLPAIAQIVSVLAVKPSTGKNPGTASPKSAFIYFLTATFVSGICFIFFLVLLRKHNIRLGGLSGRITTTTTATTNIPADPHSPLQSKKRVSLWLLFKKLRFLVFAIWLCFCVTMVFPVYTQAILSVRPPDSDSDSRVFKPDVFIPLGFLLWNIGDLTGRVACAYKPLTLSRSVPLALVAVARLGFIPLYMLCNVGGRGAVVQSDAFYWLVQLAFGVSNGWVGSNCMMAAPGFVDDDEKEACGGFMGLALVVGLASGSLLSFVVLNV